MINNKSCDQRRAITNVKAKENKNFLIFSSMRPTIVVGDRIGINKLAYDIKVPFINYPMIRLAEPLRGDIIVFESAAANNRLVKRVIGLPGDSVAMVNNQLVINDQAVGRFMIWPQARIQRSVTLVNSYMTKLMPSG